MKKSFLVIGSFLSLISATTFTALSSVPPISSDLPSITTITPLCYEVSPETFRLLNHAIGVLQHQDRIDKSGVEGPHMVMDLAGRNLETIEHELKKIDADFPENAVSEGNLKTFVRRNNITVRCGTCKLDLGESYLDNKPLSAEQLATLDVVMDKKPIQEGSLLSSIVTIVNSSFFKASCIATISAALTYYAVGLYNKDKKIEQQYSQKKWALGAATITGMGTLAFLHWPANTVPSLEDGFVEIE